MTEERYKVAVSESKESLFPNLRVDKVNHKNRLKTIHNSEK